jgi:hypothetical protein
MIFAKCVTASVTETKQDQCKGLESKKNSEGWPTWEISVRDQTTKITEVNLVSISAIGGYEGQKFLAVPYGLGMPVDGDTWKFKPRVDNVNGTLHLNGIGNLQACERPRLTLARFSRF